MKPQILKIKTSIKTFLILSMFAATTGNYADDTEIFFSVNASKPNLLFVLDVSGSMSTEVPNSGTSSNNTSQHTFSRQVVDDDDDAEQASSGGQTKRGDDHLDLGYDYYDYEAPQRVGLRFKNIDIPQNAQITNAYIQFEVSETDSGVTDTAAQLSIVAEATDDAKRFKKNGGQRIDPRDTTTANVDWNPPIWYSVGDRDLDQRTPDISVLVQSVVDRNGWEADNDMVFIIEGKEDNIGSRIAKSHDDDDDDAASIHIEYTTVTAGVDKSRLEVMQDSLRRVLEKAPDNVNVGLMNYGLEDLHYGNPESKKMHAVSGVSFPITDINAKAIDVIPTVNDVHGLPGLPDETVTVREFIADIADTWTPSSWTPIVDTLYEAALYYRGEKIHYGQSLPTRGGAHPSTYEGGSLTYPNGVVDQLVFNDPGRLRAVAPTYKSPMVSSCQANYIVLMTDGEPTYEGTGWKKGPFARRAAITVGGPQGPLADAVGTCADPKGVGNSGTCGAELTEYLATHDNMADVSASNPDGIDGDQFIKTFSIGFGTETDSDNEKYLKSLATYVDGGHNGYYAASTPEELAAAFKGILDSVAAPTGTLASPGYSVNVKNGLENEKDIYIPVFDRKNASRWTGNLKKFRIDDVNGQRLIRGKNDANATDDNGNFTAQALDIWSTSTTPDGGVVEAGGVANLLTDPSTNSTTGRKIISNLSGDVNVNLSAAENALSAVNISNEAVNTANKIDNEMLGLPGSADLELRTQIVNFMRGYVDGDTTAGARKYMGDMLHSEPLVITYAKGSGAASTGKQQYIFASTNEGYVHAFDAVSGKEKFAFIPKELLKISEPLFRNAGTQIDHKYGVDGIMNFRFKGGQDGSVDSGDQIILYFGLRRGGTSYYALDITNIDEPKLLWTKSAADYPSMGQSWSKPYIRKIGKTGSTCADGQTNCKDVIIISGGYDEDEDRDKTDGSGEVDDARTPITADVGNDILILDAQTGAKIWSMPNAMRSQITNSIPGGLRAIDFNQNELVDRLYFADTGGHVWRLDLSEAIGDSTAAPTVLTQFANLGGDFGRSSDRRMFFNEPEVSSVKLDGRSIYTISLGSGFRAHPLDDSINDKFYILVDNAPFYRLETSTANPYDTITEDDLAEIAIDGNTATNTNSLGLNDPNVRGWEFSFAADGEKVLAPSFTLSGKIVFSTLVPEAVTTGGVGTDLCKTPGTNTNTYIFEVTSGHLVEKRNFNTPGIANVVQPFFNGIEIHGDIDHTNPTGITMDGKFIDEDGNIADACQHIQDLRGGTAVGQLTNENTCTLERVYWSDPVIK